MSKITIIEGNSNNKDQVRNYMVKGEPGSDGVSPTVETSKTGTTATITITDVEGEHEINLTDGVSPTITSSKTGKVTTLTIEDAEGTKTATINDGVDLTGGIPTNGVIAFDGTQAEIPDGYEVSPSSIATLTNNYSTSSTEGYSANYINNNFEEKGTILWTNPSPTSDFASQTITLNSDDYDVLEIFYKKTGTENYSLSIKSLKGTNTLLFAIDLSLTMFCRETHYVSDTSLSFGNANLATFGGSLQQQNSRCIPLYIVGYKIGLFS